MRTPLRDVLCLGAKLVLAAAVLPTLAAEAAASEDANHDSCVTCALDDTSSQVWAVRAEYLGWWLKGNRVPPLLTTSPDGTPRADAGVIGRDATSVLLGDDRLDEGLRHGGRVSALCWLDDDRSLGAEFCFLGLSGDDTRYSAASNGSPILARPFFNVNTSAEDKALVAFPNVVDGTIDVATSSELYSASALLRYGWRRGGAGSVDVLGGYRFFRYREGLGISEALISRDPTIPVQIGTEIDDFDAFDAETDFHGGEIGLAAALVQGAFSLDVATRLGIGAVRQQVDVRGSTVVTTPGDPPGPPIPGGVLALSSNIGSFTRDRFALLPELDLTLNCQLTDCLTLSAGYSLLYLTEVVRTGDQIDYSINPTLLPNFPGPVTGDVRPAPQVKSTSLWAQGITLGAVLQF